MTLQYIKYIASGLADWLLCDFNPAFDKLIANKKSGEKSEMAHSTFPHLALWKK